MALETFDAARHHIGLCPSGDTLLGFLLSGSYDVRGQNYGTPTDFGGQRDLIGSPSLSRWTMDDFSGGVYRETWGKDPAAFSASENILPTRQDKTVRTVPPLVLFSGDISPNRDPDYVFAACGYIWTCFADDALTPAYVDRYTLADGSVTRYINPGSSTEIPDFWQGFRYDPGEQILYIAHLEFVERVQLPGFAGASGQYLNPPISGVLDVGSFGGGLELGRGVLLFNIGTRLYRLLIPKVIGTDPADADWVYVDRLPAAWIDSCSYGGLTYILCGGADQPTSVVLYDGAALNPVTDLPFNFEGRCIQMYAGRIYVAGSGKDVSGGDGYGELYEITGTSVRLVKTYAEEWQRGATSAPSSINGLFVHQGFLFFGEQGRGLVAYDITTDSFYSASMLRTPTANQVFGRGTSARGSLYVWMYDHDDGANVGVYRIATSDDDISISTSYGVVETSEFSPEPDRLKRYSLLRVLSRYGYAFLDYSTDGGGTWTAVAQTSLSTRGDVNTQSFDLSAITPAESVRFRFRLPFNTAVGYVELLAFTLGFVFLDSGKLNWTFTINGTTIVDSLDGSQTVTQDLATMVSTLRGYWRNGTPLTFRDADGGTYNVQAIDFRETQPIIAPTVPFSGGTAAREAFYALTLVEV